MRPSFPLYFREIWEKQSHWPGGQSAPSFLAGQPQISQHLDTTSWQFNLALKHHLLGNSNHCVWFSFTLGNQTQTNVWNEPYSFETMPGPAGPVQQRFLRSGQHLKIEMSALFLFASLSQHPRNADVLTLDSEFCVEELWLPHCCVL